MFDKWKKLPGIVKMAIAVLVIVYSFAFIMFPAVMGVVSLIIAVAWAVVVICMWADGYIK